MTPEHRYPALGRGVWLVLLRNEWFKARHRLAFVVALAMYAFITVMEHASSVMSARNHVQAVWRATMPKRKSGSPRRSQYHRLL